MGCFQYSPVKGARANDLAAPVPDAIKAERFDAFMRLQADISRDKLREKIGSLQTVLIDSIENDRVIARSTADAPEIDGLVYLPPEKNIQLGEFANVMITDSDDYDLYGELVTEA